MFMKRDLPRVALTVLLLISLTGCSVVRFAETRQGEGLKVTNQSGLDLDFQLRFNSATRSLVVSLGYQPSSIYKPRITRADVNVGLIALGIFGKIYYDHWNHKDTFTVLDDTFDWSGTQTWEKAVLIGVPVDILLYWCLSYPLDRKTIKGPRQPLKDHEYRLYLPDYGGSVSYRTTTGREQIKIDEFLSALRNPPDLQNVDTLKFRLSTEVEGRWYSRDRTVRGFRPLPLPPPPSESVTVAVAWTRSRVKAGEQTFLTVMVANTGTANLSGFTVKIVSRALFLDNEEWKFGNIAQGESKTLNYRVRTDKQMHRENPATVLLHFEAANGVVHPAIETHLEIIE